MRSDIVHKALANEIRKEILLRLEKKEKYLSELANELNLAPQTLDFHLNLLLEIGLVGFEWKKGKKYYFLKNKEILIYLKEGSRIPPELRPKPPHEIIIDAWDDLSKRMDKIEQKLDKLLKERKS